MRFPIRALVVLVAAILAGGAFGPQVASAQDYEDGYEGPPPPRRGYRPDPRMEPPPRRLASGVNCDAVMPGITGPHPFSCPLPAPRPLGARCYCETPPAAFTGQRTLVGEVVP